MRRGCRCGGLSSAAPERSTARIMRQHFSHAPCSALLTGYDGGVSITDWDSLGRDKGNWGFEERDSTWGSRSAESILVIHQRAYKRVIEPLRKDERGLPGPKRHMSGLCFAGHVRREVFGSQTLSESSYQSLNRCMS